MSHKILPYLQCLRTTIASFSPALEKDPALARPNLIVGKLIDRMIADYSVALTLQTEYYVSLLKILPAIEKALGSRAPDAISELKAICAAANTDDFDRFSVLAGDLQRGLIAVDTPQARDLRKLMLKMETDYSVRLDAAVVAQIAKSNAVKSDAVVARNVRTIDEKALLQFLRGNYPQETGLGIAKSNFISGGFSKFTAGITLSGARALPTDVVMRGDAAATFGGASVVDEYALIKTMYENGVCVPKPLAVDESGKVFGSPILLVEKKPGTIIGHMFNLPKTPSKAIATDIAINLAAIHRVPLAAIGTQVDSANVRTSEKALAWLEEGHKAWLPLKMPSPVFETAFEWLRRNVALNDKAPRTLVHGDFGLNNILIHDDKVSAILDWEFAHVGNPAYDLGYFYFMAKSLGSWDDFLKAYERGGMPIPDENQIDYAILFAATRLGVMVCQSEEVFVSGKEPGLASAVNIGDCYYQETIRRISGALDKVL